MLINNVGSYFTIIFTNTNPAITLGYISMDILMQAQKGENLYIIFYICQKVELFYIFYIWAHFAL